jgi:catechol 2,3-dioxygenase-like lactoylglutathione lyase family enzyme
MIANALASVAVKDVATSRRWYDAVLGVRSTLAMPEVAEWTFPRGGGLQVYELPERAGTGSCTLVVDDLAPLLRHLADLRIDTRERTDGERAKTVMIRDPDGNHVAFAQPIDPALAR